MDNKISKIKIFFKGFKEYKVEEYDHSSGVVVLSRFGVVSYAKTTVEPEATVMGKIKKVDNLPMYEVASYCGKESAKLIFSDGATWLGVTDQGKVVLVKKYENQSFLKVGSKVAIMAEESHTMVPMSEVEILP